MENFEQLCVKYGVDPNVDPIKALKILKRKHILLTIQWGLVPRISYEGKQLTESIEKELDVLEELIDYIKQNYNVESIKNR